MKKFIFIFIIILISIGIFPYEFKIIGVASDTIEWSDIAQFKDSVYYHIYSADSCGAKKSMINYINGDTFVSNYKAVDITGIAPYFAEIDTDTNGQAYITWTDVYNLLPAVHFEKCRDTTLNFIYKQPVDTTNDSTDVFITNLNIDVSQDGSFVCIAYNKIFYTLSVDSIIVDSTRIMYVVSEDSGQVFTPPRELATYNEFCFEPNIAIDDATNTIYTAYTLLDSAKNQYLYMNTTIAPYRYIDQFIYSIDSSSLAFQPIIEFRNDTVFAVFSSINRNNGYANIQMKILNNPAVLLDSIFVNGASRNQRSPQLTFFGDGDPLIAYYDSINDNTVAMYSLWNSSSGSFESDWLLWTDKPHIKRPEIIFYNPLHVYFNLLARGDGLINSYILSAKEDKAPPAPENIRVNDDTIFKWYNTTPFNVSWAYPYDYSSIYTTLVKEFDPPTSNFDTTYTVQDSLKDFPALPTGISKVYIWFMDYRGNVNFNKNGVAILKLDDEIPGVTPITGPSDGTVIESRMFPINFGSAIDSVSGIEHYSINIDTLSNMSTALAFGTNDTNFLVDTNLFAYPFRDGPYSWLIEAYDSAGNRSHTDTFEFILEATPPVILQLPHNGDSIDMPFPFTIHPIYVYDSDIKKYRIQISADSLFTSVVLDTVFGDSYMDTVLYIDSLEYDSLFWRVRGINRSGYECRYSDPTLFYINKDMPDPLHLNVLFTPDSLTEGDSLSIMSYSNKPDLDYSQSYLYGENMGQRMLTFSTVFPDTLYFANFTMPQTGVTDTQFTLFVKAVDIDSMVDSFTAYIDFYTSLSPLDISLHSLPDQPLIGDTLRITIHSNKKIDDIDAFKASGSNMGSVDILPVADTSSFNYRGKFATEGLSDSVITIMAAVEDIEGLKDTAEITVHIRFPEIWIDEDNVYVWPNPAQGNNMNVRIHALKESNAHISIFDLKGNRIFRQDADLIAGQIRDVNIDITDFKADMYFMLIQITDNEETFSFKRKFTVIR